MLSRQTLESLDRDSFISRYRDLTQSEELGENHRNESEFARLVDFYLKVAEKIVTLTEVYPSLLKLVDDEFGDTKVVFSEDVLFENCLSEGALFFDHPNFPLPEDLSLSEEMMLNYEVSLDEMLFELRNHHEKTKEFLDKEFKTDLKLRSLDCLCVECHETYRKKLTTAVFSEFKQMIDQGLDHIEDLVVSAKIVRISDSVQKLRKKVDRGVQVYKPQLKRGSYKLLEEDIRSYLKSKLSSFSDLGRSYRERLRSFFNGILVEEGFSVDLIGEAEYERFYTQLGMGLWKQPNIIKRDFLKLTRSVMAYKRKDISATILRDYLGQFWTHSRARAKKRKIIYHMGPTNSGKTYHAIEALSKAERGSYLAPLRLLASELYDTLNAKGAVTTLLTGEEVVEKEGATHYSSTIEMAKVSEDFDCVVIDEIQMITDPQRGWAWTRALVNMNADEVHLCGDPSVVGLVEQILKLTGDELVVKNYTRMTDLSVMKDTIRLVDLEKHDALVVFSRKNALKYKMDLEKLGYNVSIVYGRLSPEVRREQARKFDEGETDIMVSTDAIAMGMNLPIKRIVFSTLTKFFNSKEHQISDSEIKQIAGRAGRYKRFDHGKVTTLSKVDHGVEIVKKALSTELPQKEFAMVGPDLDIFRSVNQALEEENLNTLSLSEFLRLFNTMTFEKPFYCVDLKEMIEVTEMIEEADKNRIMSDAEVFGFACAPVNLGLVEHVQYYIWMANRYVERRYIHNEPIDVDSEDIDYLERAIKCVELYQWLARHFDNNYFLFDESELLNNKAMAIEKLNILLSEKISKRCSSCGVKLAESFEFNICEGCFKEGKFRNRRSRHDRSRAGRGKSAKGSSSKKSSGGKGRGKSSKANKLRKAPNRKKAVSAFKKSR